MITVIGSINLDIVAIAPSLPKPGETVGGGRLARYPGGKGANQALAAQRLGQPVTFIGAVGADDMAEEALSLLLASEVNLSGVAHINGDVTGVALIGVDAQGENAIIVCPGANMSLRPEDTLDAPIHHMMGVLEVRPTTLLAAASHATGFVSLNLAPAIDVPADLLARANLICVNETEAKYYGDTLHELDALIAISLGADGAVLLKKGVEIARQKPPAITVIDTVGAGDTFTAALTVALIEGMSESDALSFAVKAGALACTRRGAQPSLPYRKDVDQI